MDKKKDQEAMGDIAHLNKKFKYLGRYTEYVNLLKYCKSHKKTPTFIEIIS